MKERVEKYIGEVVDIDLRDAPKMCAIIKELYAENQALKALLKRAHGSVDGWSEGFDKEVEAALQSMEE